MAKANPGSPGKGRPILTMAELFMDRIEEESGLKSFIRVFNQFYSAHYPSVETPAVLRRAYFVARFQPNGFVGQKRARLVLKHPDGMEAPIVSAQHEFRLGATGADITIALSGMTFDAHGVFGFKLYLDSDFYIEQQLKVWTDAQGTRKGADV